MKKFRRVALIILLGFALIIGVLSLVAEFFEDAIGKKIVTEVNKQIKSELVVDGFDLSVIRAFPNVAANLTGVTLKDTKGGALLEAEEFSFRFALLSLMSSNIKFKSLVISDGALNISIDKGGKANYEIFEEAEDNGGDSDTGISLKTARLNNVELIYVDESSKQEMMLTLEEADFSGELSSTRFKLKSTAAFTSNFIEIEELRYLVGKEFGYKADVLVDLEKGNYEFQDVDVEIESNVFNVDGTITSEGENSNYDLLFSSKNLNLESLIRLLPEEYLEYLGDFRSTGDFEFEGSMLGVATRTSNPDINLSVSLEDGKITSSKLDNPFKDVSFKAYYSNGRSRDNASSSIAIENLKGYFNRELIELQLKVNNFDDPRINFAMDGVLPLEAMYGLFNNEHITDGHGEIEIKNIKLKGRYKDMIRTSRISRVETSGILEFDDAGFTMNKEKMIIDRGHLVLDNNTLSVEELKLEGAGSEIQFEGSTYNLIPVLFADSLNTNRAELEFQANLDAKSVDLDRLMKLSALYATEEEDVSEEAYDSLTVEQLEKRERYTNFLNGTFNAKIEDFNFNKIEAEDFIGKLEFENNALIIEGNTKAMEGDFDLNGRLFFEAKPRLMARLVCEDIDAYQFFNQAENFGQDVLIAKNVKGKLNAHIAISSFWDELGNFDQDKLHVLAGIGVKNGELVNFEMLEDFSTYVKIKDLRRIKFVNMQNFLEVRKSTLYIPVMFIQSNAMNLTINGEHTFENDIKYNVKVNAGQVVASRFKKHDPKLRPQKAKKKGFFNLHYQIFGNLDDYEFKSSKRDVKSDFELSELRKREIRYALEKEFGRIRFIDEPEEWKDASSDPASDDEFIDWEE